MIALTVDKVDVFVAKLQRKGINVRWDGWKMIFFKADRGALSNPAGRRLGTEWGFETVIEPNTDGKWVLDYRLTRGANA